MTWYKQVGCELLSAYDPASNGPTEVGIKNVLSSGKSKLSSAYNPTSNGPAEAGVKNVNTILRKFLNSKACFETAWPEFMIAPRENGYTPQNSSTKYR